MNALQKRKESVDRLPPYAGVSRIRFGGSKAAAFLSTAHQRSPGEARTLGASAPRHKSPAHFGIRAMDARLTAGEVPEDEAVGGDMVHGIGG